MSDDGGTKTARRTIRDYKSARRRVETLTWPGTDREVGLLYLHCGEIQDAYFRARKHFDEKNQVLDDNAAEHFQAELDHQILFKALLRPGAENPKAILFETIAQVRAELTPNEATHLIGEHRDFQNAESFEWAGLKIPAFVRQVARALCVDEDTEEEALLALLTVRLAELDTEGEA